MRKIFLILILLSFAVTAKVCAQTTVGAENIDRITLSDTVTVQIYLKNPLYTPQVVMIAMDSTNTGTVKFQVKLKGSTDGVRSRMPSMPAGQQFYVTLKSGLCSSCYNLFVKKSSSGTASFKLTN